MSESQPLRKGGGVDVHDHVHQRLDLCSASGRSNVAHQLTVAAQLLQQRLCPLEDLLPATDHEIKRSLPGLGNARRHAGLKAACPGSLTSLLHLDMNGRTDRCAIDESSPGGPVQKA